LKSSDSEKFTCNICGAECTRPARGLDRETPSCSDCGSTVRSRALVALLSHELFGLQMALPDFPVLKSLRAIGMTDPPALAGRLAEKCDYTNTFYHQSPRFDVTRPEERDLGRYDFILSSEVMEHVPPPVEAAFSNLYRLLKPDGLLLLTTPYDPGDSTIERFPGLHEYTVANLAGRAVLLNRRRDGSIEVFQDLIFHGGDGSTLEMRVFQEKSLLGMLRDAGFDDILVGAENWPEWGVDHAQTWSLPILARKGHLSVRVHELAGGYLDASRRASHAARELASIEADYAKHVAHHEREHAEMTREIERRTEWGCKMEHDLEERTQWAKSLERERDEALAAYGRASESVELMEQELERTRAALNGLRRAVWTRVGRALRLIR
jgi:SAM-dependent methyltransferase